MGRGGADLPTLTRIPKFLIIALQTHAEIGWLFVYVQYGPFTKKRASYVPWFKFDGIFFDKKSGFSNFAKNGDFSKSSQGYIFDVDGCAFRFWPFTSKERALAKRK